jgi:NitT/TauT family transport system permease protein
VTTTVASLKSSANQERRPLASRRPLATLVQRAGFATVGIGLTLGLWWLAGLWLAANPDMAPFAGFAPGATFAALWQMAQSGWLWSAAGASLYRVGAGLGWAIAIGVPLGIVIGGSRAVAATTHLPFQFLRMVSPLAWMPVAIIVFATWDGAIIFLIAAAAIWPILFATANGLRKIDPHWFTVARNLGGRGFALLQVIVLPAIAQDLLTGIRLGLGVAWIVLVPAEFLGVTSGLGFAINDARDTLEYDRLTAIVIVIGIVGLTLDGILLALIRRFRWHSAD